MKSARKPKDFSIESILADTFIFIQNDQYRKTARSIVSKKYEINSQKGEECQTNPETEFKMNTENKVVVNTKDSFEFAKANPALNLTSNFEITMGTMFLINNECKNYEFDKRDNCDVWFQQKCEVNAEEKREVSFELIKSEQCNQKEQRESLSNTEKNDIVDYFHKISDTTEKCTTDVKTAHLITLNFNEINSLKTVKHIEKEYIINSKKFKPLELDANYKEINECYYNIKINEQKMDTISVKEDQKKHYHKVQQEQLKHDERNDLCNNHIKCVNNSCINLLESKNKDMKIDFHRKLEKLENKHLFHDQSKKLIKQFRNKTENLEILQNIQKLEWLQCTRYKPPKIPRKLAINKNRRKPSIHPRIPFSTFQLDFLEQKFRNSAYLLKHDVLEISNVLNLPSNRVKIWFQNRRARERREFCTDM